MFLTHSFTALEMDILSEFDLETLLACQDPHPLDPLILQQESPGPDNVPTDTDTEPLDTNPTASSSNIQAELQHMPITRQEFDRELASVREQMYKA